MNVTQTSLEALILKATHESLPKPDTAAIEAFCAVTRDSPDGPQLAAQALAARIHTPNAKEAILALIMLDRCMRRCGASFRSEVGKFRFLNEMIKLVSPKYLADRTASVVRMRILQLLHTWSIEYPKETKFKVAFDMLKSQGVIKEPISPLPSHDVVPISKPKPKCAIFEDEEKSKLLQKLLQSKKPEDLQHANRLIKSMVREDERTEVYTRKSQEVLAALDSADLLKDMLLHAKDASADEEQLIHELYTSCMGLRPVLQQLASSDTVECLGEIIYASDILDDVFEKYNQFVAEKNKQRNSEESGPTSTDRLLDFAGVELSKGDANKTTTIDDLGDIFSSDSATTAVPLKPVNLMTNEDVELLDDRNKNEGWNELDNLGEQLLKQSLPENARRHNSFTNKKSKKIPMNAIEKTSPKHEPQNAQSLLDLDFFTQKCEEPASPRSFRTGQLSSDDVMVDIGLTNGAQNVTDAVSSPTRDILDLDTPGDDRHSQTEPKERHRGGEVKPLTDIEVSLESVQPSKVPPLTAYQEEDGLTVVFHVCADKPRPDVDVLVVSTTSRCKSSITEYKFQSVVPKGCRVRLLSPSGTSLPAFNPFLPPPALTQVMLVGRPPSLAQLTLKFVITYTCDDEVLSEIGQVQYLPIEHV